MHVLSERGLVLFTSVKTHRRRREPNLGGTALLPLACLVSITTWAQPLYSYYIYNSYTYVYLPNPNLQDSFCMQIK